MDPVIRQIEAEAVRAFVAAGVVADETLEAHQRYTSATDERNAIFCEMANRYGIPQARELLGLTDE
jgi:hypothetical protein